MRLENYLVFTWQGINALRGKRSKDNYLQHSWSHGSFDSVLDFLLPSRMNIKVGAAMAREFKGPS